MTPELRAEYGVEGDWAAWLPHRIRWDQCDLYGHVNHAAYLALCEDLRCTQWLELGGVFRPDQPGPVMAQLEARYLKPLGYDDRVLLTLRPASLRRSSFVHEYAVWKQGAVFTCRAVLVVVRQQDGAKLPIPDALRTAMLAQGAVQEG